MSVLNEPKDFHYLPHLTWPEVRDLAKTTDVVIIPLGAIEQHGPALPEGTDILGAIAVSREASRRANCLCAPVLFPGLSAHHMGFAGTLTLSEETFAAVVLECAECLACHGFTRVVLSNFHGGNEAALTHIAQRITRETKASALLFGIAELRRVYLADNIDKLDIHAGIGETSSAMYEFPSLVRVESLERPTLNLDLWRRTLLGRVRQEPDLLKYVTLGLPATHELSSNGCITLGDVKEASPERGRELFDGFVSALVAFVERWREATSGGR